jgi:crossover junction endodeoxyribonuclease RuvC
VTARAPVRILGIDPGTASTGFGVVESAGQRLSAVCGGVVSTSPSLPPEQRLAAIAARVGDLLDEHAPHALAVEEVYFGRNVRSAFAVGQARGAVLAVAGGRDLPCFSYTPQAVKLAVCGTGAAAKDQVKHMVGVLLSLPVEPPSDHAADALAVAVCHASHARSDQAAEAVAVG